jgi:GT2 family glycosyltransferase
MVQSVGQGFTRVGYVDGIAPLISLDCLQEIGGLDMGDNQIGYGVDVWLSFRAAEKGWAVIVDQEVVARHRYHETARQITGLMERAAVLEHDYLACRLGENYRSHLRVLSGQIETIM